MSPCDACSGAPKPGGPPKAAGWGAGDLAQPGTLMMDDETLDELEVGGCCLRVMRHEVVASSLDQQTERKLACFSKQERVLHLCYISAACAWLCLQAF